METNDQKRIEQLYEQIIEIAKGNFEYKNTLSESRDQIGTIAQLLNMMSEEITFLDSLSIQKSRLLFANQLVIVDEQGFIKSYSPNFFAEMGYPKSYFSQSIYSFLDKTSEDLLKYQLLEAKNESARNRFNLSFKSANNASIDFFCNLDKVFFAIDKELYIINVYQDDQPDLKPDKEFWIKDYKSLKEKRANNRMLVREVRLYVLKNLDKMLPSLKKIGLIHQTNQTKLKVEFKKAYGITIHQFHTQKRLEKAELLLRATELPVYEVAKKCGYNELAHFSRKFKKQFGLSPSYYRSKLKGE